MGLFWLGGGLGKLMHLRKGGGLHRGLRRQHGRGVHGYALELRALAALGAQVTSRKEPKKALF